MSGGVLNSESLYHDAVLCNADLLSHILEMLDSSCLLVAVDVNRNWRLLIRHCKFLWNNTRLLSTSTDLEGLRALYHARETDGMEAFDASRCRYLSNTFLSAFSAETRSTRNLRHLNLSRCNKLDIDSLCTQWGGVLSLETLTLDWCHNVSDATAYAICGQANKMKKPTAFTKISMRGCPVGDAGITLLCQCVDRLMFRPPPPAFSQCFALATLLFLVFLLSYFIYHAFAPLSSPSPPSSSCPSLFFFFLLVVFYGIFFILSFFRYSPILESVDVSLVPFNRLKRLTKVSDDFLLALASLPCPNLVAVNVAGHASITDFGVTALAYRLPALRRFDVTCCAAVTRQGQAGVSAICKSKATEADFDCGVSVGSLSSSEDDMSE